MRTLLILTLAGTVLLGCRDRGSTSAAPRPARSPTPPDVLRLADAYVASQAIRDPQQRDKVREQFISFFFDGFTASSTAWLVGPEASRRAYVAGQEYRRANPTKIQEIMAGFGYTVVETEGTWTVDFEVSAFCARGHPKETWWLSSFGETSLDLPPAPETSNETGLIRVKGYLSPAGSFGHLGGYHREFFATEVSRANGANPALFSPFPVHSPAPTPPTGSHFSTPPSSRHRSQVEPDHRTERPPNWRRPDFSL